VANDFVLTVSRNCFGRRIRAGKRKAEKKKNNPFDIKAILSPKWAGFAERPIIEKVTGRPYEEVKKEVLDAFVQHALHGLTKGK